LTKLASSITQRGAVGLFRAALSCHRMLPQDEQHDTASGRQTHAHTGTLSLMLCLEIS